MAFHFMHSFFVFFHKIFHFHHIIYLETLTAKRQAAKSGKFRFVLISSSFSSLVAARVLCYFFFRQRRTRLRMTCNGDFEISSIIETSKCMGSDKITERRKNAETLDILLSNQNYVSKLDDNTDANHGFTWNDVLNAAIAYMNKVVSISNYLNFYQ